jgi:acetyl esterase/lipase
MSEITRRGFLGTTLAGAAVPALGATAQNAPSDGVTVEKDVPFGKGGDIELKLDIYRSPKAKEKRMATIHFHGGGFTRLTKDSLSERIRPFAALGYTAIAAQYRLAGEAGYPALIHDAKAAIRWVRSNASKLDIDPARIAVVGYSAGGYHALFTAGTGERAEFEGSGGNPGVSTKVAACIAFYPATTVPGSMLPAGTTDEGRRAASATTHIAAGFPPTMILHGFKDTTISIDSSFRLVQQFRDANVPIEFHAIEGAPHVFDSNVELAVAAAHWADVFMERHVVNPHTYPPFQSEGARGGRGRGGQQ